MKKAPVKRRVDPSVRRTAVVLSRLFAGASPHFVPKRSYLPLGNPVVYAFKLFHGTPEQGGTPDVFEVTGRSIGDECRLDQVELRSAVLLAMNHHRIHLTPSSVKHLSTLLAEQFSIDDPQKDEVSLMTILAFHPASSVLSQIARELLDADPVAYGMIETVQKQVFGCSSGLELPAMLP